MKPTYFKKPSIKSLLELNITEEQAIAARALMAGETRVKDNPLFPKTNDWIKRCYHNAPRIDLILSALDELLEYHGVEPIKNKGGEIIAEYLNGGDTYTPTILFNYGTETFRVTCWGGFVEKNQRRYSLV